MSVPDSDDMDDSIPLVGPNDTVVNPASRSQPAQDDGPSPGDTVVSPSSRSQTVQVAGDARRSTVLPRLDWTGPVPTAQPSTRLRFEELGPLGKGGMGEVVLAKDHDIERTVAIKRLSEPRDLGLVMRFVDEIRTVGALEHPNIVPVHDVGVDEAGRYYFVMKHLRGATLDAIIEKLRAGDRETHQRFPFHVRMQVFLGVLNAMEYAHQQGFVHRDLKPANIMVGPFGEVTVMDWGLARKQGSGPEVPAAASVRQGTALETQAGAVMGTPLYMSPEQTRGEPLDARTDTYSLCVVFHEFLSLSHYLHELSDLNAILDGVRSRTPDVFAVKQHPAQPAVPAELGWYLLKGFSKDPAQRYQSVREMIDALQKVVDGRVDVQCQRTFAKRMFQEAIHRVDAHPVAIIIGSTLVLSLILAGVVNTLLQFF